MDRVSFVRGLVVEPDTILTRAGFAAPARGEPFLAGPAFACHDGVAVTLQRMHDMQ